MGTFTDRFRSAYRAFTHPAPSSGYPLSILPPSTGVRGQNSSGSPYDAGSSGRRSYNWNPSRLGPTSVITSTQDRLLPRSRQQVRNDPWARSAADNFQSQMIGRGIRPRWNITDPELKKEVETKFNRWAKHCDANNRLGFYGLQSLVAREMFEAGECFARFYVRPTSWKLKVPLQIQLIESEQVPIWREGSAFINMPKNNEVRAGIEFDPYQRRVAYHMFRQHPGESIYNPGIDLSPTRVPADDVLHCHEVLRAGQLRGEPRMSAVLTLLYELEQYTDAELLRKKIQAMWAAFIEKQSADIDVVPTNPNLNDAGQPAPQSNDPGVGITELEGGTINELLPGEKITFPNMPQDSDFSSFMDVMGHRFAIAVGASYEQITGDLRGVNLSSIRAGLLDVRRKCEMFQFHTFNHQFNQPIAERWLYEAVLAGYIEIPDYVEDPDQYNEIQWAPQGWPWIDPEKEINATKTTIRTGLSSLQHEISATGRDIQDVFAEIEADNTLMDKKGLVLDTDPRKVLDRGQAASSEEEAAAAPPPPRTATSPARPAGPQPVRRGR